MATITIYLDATAWFRWQCPTVQSPLAALPMAGAVGWQNVTRDEMCIGDLTYPSSLASGDVTAIREVFRALLLPLHAALISCDLVEFDGFSGIRTLAKYRP